VCGEARGPRFLGSPRMITFGRPPLRGPAEGAFSVSKPRKSRRGGNRNAPPAGAHARSPRR
jgi:hypothetical protein